MCNAGRIAGIYRKGDFPEIESRLEVNICAIIHGVWYNGSGKGGRKYRPTLFEKPGQWYIGELDTIIDEISRILVRISLRTCAVDGYLNKRHVACQDLFYHPLTWTTRIVQQNLLLVMQPEGANQHECRL